MRCLQSSRCNEQTKRKGASSTVQYWHTADCQCNDLLSQHLHLHLHSTCSLLTNMHTQVVCQNLLFTILVAISCSRLCDLTYIQIHIGWLVLRPHCPIQQHAAHAALATVCWPCHYYARSLAT
jgi:hypothetical protein